MSIANIEVTDSNQQTIRKEVSIEGIGLFTGKKIKLRLLPAPVNSGIVFQRVDLPQKPKFLASLDFVKETHYCTFIKNEAGSIQTVEHLLSTLAAYGIDNLFIEIDGPELPIGDGSSLIFVNMIEEATLALQEAKKEIIKVLKPIYYSDKDIHLIALPSDEYKISYTLHYSHNTFLKSQHFDFLVNSGLYKKEISSCRTFSIYEEIKHLIENKFIRGGGLNNAVIIKDNKVINPDGTRFPDEMVRHKVLDLIGDLSLLAKPLLAHIIAIRSGHFSNILFAKKIKDSITLEIHS